MIHDRIVHREPVSLKMEMFLLNHSHSSKSLFILNDWKSLYNTMNLSIHVFTPEEKLGFETFKIHFQLPIVQRFVPSNELSRSVKLRIGLNGEKRCLCHSTCFIVYFAVSTKTCPDCVFILRRKSKPSAYIFVRKHLRAYHSSTLYKFLQLLKETVVKCLCFYSICLKLLDFFMWVRFCLTLLKTLDFQLSQWCWCNYTEAWLYMFNHIPCGIYRKVCVFTIKLVTVLEV